MADASVRSGRRTWRDRERGPDDPLVLGLVIGLRHAAQLVSILSGRDAGLKRTGHSYHIPPWAFDWNELDHGSS